MTNKAIYKMTTYAMIIAIIAVMTFIPEVGYISIGGVISFTTVHVVVLICAMVFGWQEAFVAGITMGVCSLIKAAAMPQSVFDPDFINPFISVLPRAIFGLAAGFTYEGINKIPSRGAKYTLAIIAAPVLTLFHSVITLSCYWLWDYLWFPIHEGTMMALLSTIFTVNGLIEMGIALVLVPSISLGVAAGLHGKNHGMKFEELLRRKKTMYPKLVKDYETPLKENLVKFCAINSAYDEASSDEANPYGLGVTKALNFIKDLATSDGFRATIYDNQVCEILIGEGEKNITIMSHCDTVPAGDGWEGDPFTVREEDGILYGRGVSDDKGPTLSAYYAVKALSDNHMLGNYQVRILVGGNEERGSSELKYYFHTLNKAQPTYGFTPDSDFPLVYGEKGMINYMVRGKVDIPGVKSIKAGTAFNAVIDKCSITMEGGEKLAALLAEDNIPYSLEKGEEGDEVIVYGKSAHGSMPEKGINAGMLGLKYLSKLYPECEIKVLAKNYENVNGLGIGGYASSSVFGLNTLNVGIITYENGELIMAVNFRHGETTDPEVVMKNIEENTAPFEAKFMGTDKLLYYPTDSPLVKTLLKAYRDETGDISTQPYAIGGGTYAKEADNVVAFGIEKADFDTYMHSNKERVKVSALNEAMAIYAHAIVDLGKLIENENEVQSVG
ncbi:MAG: Sapep family Mn(2+)-dependent dipeptidase [Coprobacillus sp.]|nr:Sapep family Mn(2+)-dependent dipeptidase [Coprobacillus sp.]